MFQISDVNCFYSKTSPLISSQPRSLTVEGNTRRVLLWFALPGSIRKSQCFGQSISNTLKVPKYTKIYHVYVISAQLTTISPAVRCIIFFQRAPLGAVKVSCCAVIINFAMISERKHTAVTICCLASVAHLACEKSKLFKITSLCCRHYILFVVYISTFALSKTTNWQSKARFLTNFRPEIVFLFSNYIQPLKFAKKYYVFNLGSLIHICKNVYTHWKTSTSYFSLEYLCIARHSDDEKQKVDHKVDLS